MPFKLAQGPIYPTALMQKLLGKFNDFCLFHLNDILVHYKYEEDHLKQKLEQIKEVGLELKLSKCAFFKRHLQYLGHLISSEGIYPLKEKVASLIHATPQIVVTKTRHHTIENVEQTSVISWMTPEWLNQEEHIFC